jgi:hypothetical protein
MFSIPGVLGLIFLTFVRPQAFVLSLAGVPLVHLVYLATLVGLVLDLRLRLIRPRATPLLWWALAYLAWCMITVGLRAPSQVSPAFSTVFICMALFFVTAHAIQSWRALRVAAACLATIGVFLAVVGVHQGLAPHGCIVFKGSPVGEFDGRACEAYADCLADPEPGAHYECEHIGLFGTYSINQRVRWLGIIQDPNELAMCIALGVPLLIGLYLRRPSLGRGVLFAICGGFIALCTVFTQSRGGQLVFLAAPGVYFIRRYGLKGLAVCALAALPVLLLGGRSGQEADLSKMERIEALYIAMSLLMRFPLTGCGFTQFTEYNQLTAHNSYALAAAELGLPGLFLFVMMMYVSAKTFIVAIRRYAPVGPSRVAYVWAGALLAAQCGIMLGILFLSFNVQPILWTFLGVCGGYYLTVRRHDPGFALRLGPRDYALVGSIITVMISIMFVYSRVKMAQGAA